MNDTEPEPAPEVCPRCLLLGRNPPDDCVHYRERQFASWNEHGEYFPPQGDISNGEDTAKEAGSGG